MGSFWLDVRHSLRSLRGSATFTLVTLLVLAIGIGSNTAMFSLVRGVLFKPLPFAEPERLVWLTESLPALDMPVFPFNAPDFEDLQQYSQTLDDSGAFALSEVELSLAADSETVSSARVSANLFRLLGLRPALGRDFAEEEDVPRSGVVMLSYDLWQSRFGGSSEVLGRRIELDRTPYTVIGVLPKSAAFPLQKMPLHGQAADLFVPAGFTEIELANRGMMHNFGVIGRLAEGVGFAAAADEMTSMGQRILANYPGAEDNTEFQLFVEITPLREAVVGQIERPLLLLLGAMLLVMLVVCANLANLTLSRSMARRGEMAVRAALGASKARLLQMYLIESLLLALGGGLLGLTLASALLKTSRLVLQGSVPLADRVVLDPTVLLFALGLSVLVAGLFGIAPLFGKAFNSLNVASVAMRGTAGRRERTVLRGVAVATMVLAVVLLVGAGLLLRSFGRLTDLDPGFEGSQVLTMSVALPNRAYGEPERVQGFVAEVEESLAALPGVQSAAVSSALPMEFRERRGVQADGAVGSAARRSVNVTWATPSFFDTMQIPLRSGRAFVNSDRADAAPVVIVTASLARQFWGTEEAAGRSLAWQFSEAGEPIYAEVVGVVGEVNDGPLGSEPFPHVYVPQAQFDARELEMAVATDSNWGRVFRLSVRSQTGDPTLLANAVVDQIHQIDRSLAVSEIRPLDDILRSGVFAQRLSAGLVTLFALTALLLAAIGLYGVLAYATSQRRREFGLRLALGAEAGSLVKMVMTQGLRLSALGLGIGLLAAAALSRLMASVLYETSTADPLTLLAVAVVLLFSAAVASLVPAWRAGRVDPMSTLRP
jgi:predicted permease